MMPFMGGPYLFECINCKIKATTFDNASRKNGLYYSKSKHRFYSKLSRRFYSPKTGYLEHALGKSPTDAKAVTTVSGNSKSYAGYFYCPGCGKKTKIKDLTQGCVIG